MNRDAVIFFATLFLIACLGVVIRWHFALEPLWIDELHTAWSTNPQITFFQMIDRAGQGNQTPLYFAIAWTIQTALGFSELVLRSTSLLAAMLAIIVAAIWVRNSTRSSACGLVTATLLAADYWAIIYGSEARPYALVQLLAIVQTSSLFQEHRYNNNRKDRNPRISWQLFFTTACLLLTHLSTILLVAAQVLFILIQHKHFNLRRITYSFAAAFLSLAISFPVVSQVLYNRSDWSSVYRIHDLLQAVWPSLIAAVFIPGIISIWGNPKRHPIWLLGACSTIPLIIVVVMQLTGFATAASYRYVCYATPLATIFAGLAVGTLNSRSHRIAVSICIVLIAITANPLTRNAASFYSYGFRQENWQQTVSKLNEFNTGKSQLVFLFPNLIEDHRLQTEHTDKFSQYISFPLTSAYRLNPESTIVPMPTITAKPRWSAEHIESIIANDGCEIAARADKHLFAQILNELTQTASDQKAEFNIQIFEQDMNVVRIARVTLVERRTSSDGPD